MSRVQLLILGAGRFAQDVADWAAEIPGVVPIGFYQDEQDGGPATLDGLPIFSDAQLREQLPSCQVVCAVGSPGRVAFVEKITGWERRSQRLSIPPLEFRRRRPWAPARSSALWPASRLMLGSVRMSS